MNANLEIPDWLTTLAAALQRPGVLPASLAVRPGRGGRPAAVLILIGSGATGPELVFVERATSLRKHPGQIAFPGGAADRADGDLANTALREAFEEIGVDRRGVLVIGSLPPAHVAVSGFDVTGVVGWWWRPSPVGVVDEREVASVELISVAELTTPGHRAMVRHPSGYVGPAFEVGGHLIWGLTANLVDALLELAGWQQPWDRTRLVAIPDRYLTDRSRTGGPDDH